MKLSVAIRLGSMASEKAIGTREDDNGARCAIGAAEFAAGLGCGEAENHWEFMRDTAICPVTGITESINWIIAGLNNGQLRDGKNITPWSRESIAYWVEAIEPKETPALTPETEEVCVGR